MKLVASCITLLGLLHSAAAFPTCAGRCIVGVPAAAPHGGPETDLATGGYTVTVNGIQVLPGVGATSVIAGQEFDITLSGPDFRGFLIMLADEPEGDLVGPDGISKQADGNGCAGTASITHTSNDLKQEVTVTGVVMNPKTTQIEVNVVVQNSGGVFVYHYDWIVLEVAVADVVDEPMATEESPPDDVEPVNPIETVEPTMDTTATVSPTETTVDLPVILELADQKPELSTLLDLLFSFDDLVEALSEDGTFTVFAPLNSAFDALPDELVNTWQVEGESLRNVILYHVLDSVVLSSDLEEGAVVTALNGAELTVTSLDPVTINNAVVVTADILASNGVVHLIDKVLLPPGVSLDEPVAVANDQCSTAIRLELGEIVAGSTVGATADLESSSNTCGTAIPRDSSPGVWYKVVGTGSLLTVTTCTGESMLGGSFDSQMLVYTGSCGNLTCIAGNDDAYDGTCYYGEAGVTFSSIAGVDYYVLVYSYSSSASAMGTFGVTAFEEEADPTPAPTPRPQVLNDNCISASPLELGEILAGSTLGATADLESSTNTCGGAESRASSPGVWYSVVGTGGLLTVTTCTGDSTLDGFFDSQMLVYIGSCGNLTCIAGNDDYFGDSCGSGESRASFASAKAVDYYVLVYSYSSLTGSFGITAFQGDGSEPAAENDDCSSALLLEVGEVLVGSTAGSTVDSIPTYCGEVSQVSSPGVWYYLIGEGIKVSVTTCVGNSTLEGNFDSQMLVFSGSCGNLTCVGGNDDVARDSCGLEAGVNFFAEAGVDYYILVYGYGVTDTGIFGITVLTEPEPGSEAPSEQLSSSIADAVGRVGDPPP